MRLVFLSFVLGTALMFSEGQAGVYLNRRGEYSPYRPSRWVPRAFWNPEIKRGISSAGLQEMWNPSSKRGINSAGIRSYVNRNQRSYLNRNQRSPEDQGSQLIKYQRAQSTENQHIPAMGDQLVPAIGDQSIPVMGDQHIQASEDQQNDAIEDIYPDFKELAYQEISKQELDALTAGLQQKYYKDKRGRYGNKYRDNKSYGFWISALNKAGNYKRAVNTGLDLEFAD